MKIDNPYHSVPFENVSKDKQGQEEYGYRTIDGLEEVIHIPSGRSNMNYYKPEIITRYGDCQHVFRIVNMGIREVECRNCQLLTSFHPAVNYIEREGKSYIRLNGKEFEILQ